MSVTAVRDYVATTKVAGISGINTVHKGAPPSLPYSDAPLAIVETGTPRRQQVTAGSGGTVYKRFTVTIRVMLAAADCDADEAQRRALPLYDAVPAAFTNDRTLGGTCWDAELSDPYDNLTGDAYRQAGLPPEIGWRLAVTEETTANAGS